MSTRGACVDPWMSRDGGDEAHYAEVLYFFQHGDGAGKRTFAVVAWMVPIALSDDEQDLGFQRFQGATMTRSLVRGVDFLQGTSPPALGEALRGRVVPLSAIVGLAHLSHDCSTGSGEDACDGSVHNLTNTSWLHIIT